MGVGDVARVQGDRRIALGRLAVGVAPGPFEGGRVDFDRVHLDIGAGVGDRQGQGARARAQVHDDGRVFVPDALQLAQRPGEQQLGFGARYENTGPDGQVEFPHRREAREVLQRNAFGAAIHQLLELGNLLGGHHRHQGQARALDAEHVRGEEFGIGAGAVHTGRLQTFGGAGDQRAKLYTTHAVNCARFGGHRLGYSAANLAARSASTNASRSASRSPSSTESKLWALKPMRWSAIRFSG